LGMGTPKEKGFTPRQKEGKKIEGTFLRDGVKIPIGKHGAFRAVRGGREAKPGGKSDPKGQGKSESGKQSLCQNVQIQQAPRGERNLGDFP